MSSRVTSIPPGPSVPETLAARGAVLLPSSPDERTELLDETEWGRRFTWEQLTCFAKYLRRYELPIGRQLFREGDHDAFLAIVITGRLDIHKNDIEDRDRLVAQIRKGKLVGEMSLLDGAARSATAVAGEPTELLVLAKSDFLQLGREHPSMALDLTLAIATTIAQLLRQTTGALVDHLEA
ncbi:MAG: Crp/Fnr family transcriptional regulator [Gemmatimonadales bacterium]